MKGRIEGHYFGQTCDFPCEGGPMWDYDPFAGVLHNDVAFGF